MAKTETDLKELIKDLNNQIAWGLINYEIWKKMKIELMRPGSDTVSWFFVSTLLGNYDLTVLCLFRLTDERKQNDVLTVKYLLTTIKNMVGNKNIELADPAVVLEKIDYHLNMLETLEAQIGSIHRVRHTIVGHASIKHAIGDLRRTRDYTEEPADLGYLFTTLHGIVDYYAKLFPESSWDVYLGANEVELELDWLLRFIKGDLLAILRLLMMRLWRQMTRRFAG